MSIKVVDVNEEAEQLQQEETPIEAETKQPDEAQHKPEEETIVQQEPKQEPQVSKNEVVDEEKPERFKPVKDKMIIYLSQVS